MAALKESRLYRQLASELKRKGMDIQQLTQTELRSLPKDLQVVVENFGVQLHTETQKQEAQIFIDEARNIPRKFISSYLAGQLAFMDSRGRQLFSNGQWNNYPAAPAAVLERPSKDILQRVAISDIQPVDDMDLRVSLALESETLLGYSVLRKELKLTSPLAATLKELEIEPFSRPTVTKYKDDMRAFATQEVRKKNPSAYGLWTVVSISGYPKPIPEVALQKACEIKRALPAAQIMVEELNIYPDPFLVAILGGESFFIEVWDEPKFQG